jgi:hypothetical protein
MITSSELPYYFVIGLAALPAPIGVYAALYYNVKTFRIVRRIQGVYRLQGVEWFFWMNRDRLIAFVLNPSVLLIEVPPLAGEEKMLLISHRQTMKSYLMRTFVFMFSSFSLAIVLLLVTALMRK